MVWNCSESSDSEAERHDRFRSERTNVPKTKLDVRKILNVSVGRSNHSRGTGGGETRDQRGICARCDYRVESCRCRSRLSPDTSDRHTSSGRRHRSDSEERHSRKRRSSGDEQRAAKRKTKDGRSEDVAKQHNERNGQSRQDTEQKKQRKKCKKKLKEKMREENLKKSKSPKQSDPAHTPERSIADRVTSSDPAPVKKTDAASTDDFNDVYGPALPIRNQDVVEGEETTTPSQSVDEGKKGEAADTPSCLPTQQQEEDDEDSAAYGPVLPPEVGKPKQRVYGPTLPSAASSDPSPPHSTASETARELDRAKGQEDDDSQHDDDNDHHDDGDDVGPLPEGSHLTPSQIQLQHRANLLRLHMENKGDLKEVKREEWMIELPDRQRTNIGTLLAPRSFRTKESASVDPSWTDTPQEKAKKETLSQLGLGDSKRDKEELKKQAGKQRDKQMDLLAEKAKKRSDKSLLEMHQHKLSKEKKKDEKAGERRPFNRETDLGISRLTQAQKQSIYKKAAALDSRFSSGQSKYL